MGIGKHKTVSGKVLERLGDLGDLSTRRHGHVFGGHRRVCRERAGVNVRTRAQAHIGHHSEIHVGSRPIHQLLTGEERFCGGRGITGAEHSGSRELISWNPGDRVPLLIHGGNEWKVRSLVQGADEISDRVDIALEISG